MYSKGQLVTFLRYTVKHRTILYIEKHGQPDLPCWPGGILPRDAIHLRNLRSLHVRDLLLVAPVLGSNGKIQLYVENNIDNHRHAEDN